MKKVYAITTGGSTLDIMGIFEDEELANKCVEDWRTHMGVYDDGWGIQEFVLWDRLPNLEKYYTHIVYLDNTTLEVLETDTDYRPIYEWFEYDKPARIMTCSVSREMDNRSDFFGKFSKPTGRIRVVIEGYDLAEIEQRAIDVASNARREMTFLGITP